MGKTNLTSESCKKSVTFPKVENFSYTVNQNCGLRLPWVAESLSQLSWSTHQRTKFLRRNKRGPILSRPERCFEAVQRFILHKVLNMWLWSTIVHLLSSYSLWSCLLCPLLCLYDQIQYLYFVWLSSVHLDIFSPSSFFFPFSFPLIVNFCFFMTCPKKFRLAFICDVIHFQCFTISSLLAIC